MFGKNIFFYIFGYAIVRAVQSHQLKYVLQFVWLYTQVFENHIEKMKPFSLFFFFPFSFSLTHVNYDLGDFVVLWLSVYPLMSDFCKIDY